MENAEPDARAADHYEAALRLHAMASRPFEHARTALPYGEWLRRARRKAEARIHLRTALETFERLGATPWTERARTELGATGTAAPRQPPPGALAVLTPQELQIVRLASRGLSNRVRWPIGGPAALPRARRGSAQVARFKPIVPFPGGRAGKGTWDPSGHVHTMVTSSIIMITLREHCRHANPAISVARTSIGVLVGSGPRPN